MTKAVLFDFDETLQDRTAAFEKYMDTFLDTYCPGISKEEKENPLIKKVFGYIQEHIAENFSLDDAASFAGVSSFYLSKLFKEETGETFINYVTDRRLEKGRIMLCETELSIKEISAEIGYNDQNYFSRIFKNKFGISPTDFRNTNRNSESL